MKVKIKKENFDSVLLRFRMTKSMLARKAGIASISISRLISKYGSPSTADKLLKVLPGVVFDDIFFTID